MKTLTSTVIALCASVWIAFAQAPAVRDRGGLNGRVVDDSGVALSGARVSAASIRLFTAGGETAFSTESRPAVRSATADKAGAFSISGLWPGIYRVCIVADGEDLPPSCDWRPAVEIPVMPLVTANAVLTVPRGREVQVRVVDPGGALDANEKVKESGVNLLVGIWKGTQFYPARLAAADKNARIYSIAVPFDTPVKLAVRGENLNAQDSNGRAVGKSERIDINEPKSDNRNPKTFDYAITGLCNNGNGNGNGNCK